MVRLRVDRHQDRKARRAKAGRVVSTTLLVLFAALVSLAAVQVVTGAWRVSPVLSGSMRPGLATGGVVIAQRVPVVSLEVNDVVIFHPPGEGEVQVVHRIVMLDRADGGTVIQTKGDNNRVEDPWRATLRGDTAYRVRWAVPGLGYVALWMHRPDVHRYTVILAGILVLAAVVVVIVPQRKPDDPAPEDDVDTGAEDSAQDGAEDGLDDVDRRNDAATMS